MRALTALFAKSPFGPMQEHMQKVVACARLVRPFFEALEADDEARVAEIRDKIFLAEEEADFVKNDVRNHLPKSIFMPIDRRDLLDVLEMQDSIADSAQDIAGLLDMRPMKVPAVLRDDLLAVVDSSLLAVELAGDIADRLDELLEASFGGPQAERVFGMISKLSDLEHDNDVAGQHFTRRLFEIEDDLKPLDVIFWYQIAILIGDLADYSHKMGNRLRLLIAKH